MNNNIFNKLNLFIEKNLTKLKLVNRIVALICVYLIYGLVSNSSLNIIWSWGYLVSFAVILLGYFFQSLSWSFLLNNNFKRETIISWFLSLIGKYFPLKLGVPLMRVSEDFKTKEVDSKKYFIGVIKEVLYQIISGTVIVSIFWVSNKFNFSFVFLTIIYLALLLLLNLYRNSSDYLIIFFNTISYSLFLFAIFFLLQAEGYNQSLSIAVAYIGSSIASLLFIGSPAGIGIREYIFINLFNNQEIYSNINFLEIAIVVRAIFLLVDISGYLIFKILNVKGNQKF